MSYQHFALLKERGVEFAYQPTKWTSDFAMDAQPTLVTTPNNGIPAYLTQVVDPSTVQVVYAEQKAEKILGSKKMGAWTDRTYMVPMTEATGEVSSYGDFNNNGRAGMNLQYEYRQAYLYQAIIEYGQLEEETTALAKISWAAGLQQSAIRLLNTYQNLTWFYGVGGLQNFGLLNDPNLNASINAGPKAAGGTTWLNGNGPNATANEVYNDVLSLFTQLVNQTSGLVEIDQQSALVLALAPAQMSALAATNTFGLTAKMMIMETFPQMRIESAVQYGASSTINTQGNPAGNFMQMFAIDVAGVETGFVGYNEKLKTHAIIQDLSSFKQKATQGTWGAVLKFPAAIAGMLGT